MNKTAWTATAAWLVNEQIKGLLEGLGASAQDPKTF